MQSDNVVMELLPEGSLYECQACHETMFLGNEVLGYLDYMDRLDLVDKDVEEFRRRHEQCREKEVD